MEENSSEDTKRIESLDEQDIVLHEFSVKNKKPVLFKLDDNSTIVNAIMERQRGMAQLVMDSVRHFRRCKDGSLKTIRKILSDAYGQDIKQLDTEVKLFLEKLMRTSTLRLNSQNSSRKCKSRKRKRKSSGKSKSRKYKRPKRV